MLWPRPHLEHDRHRQATAGMSGFQAFDGKQYLNLETFRRNGNAVQTPVWFAAAPEEPATLYVYSLSQSGKAKRIRRNGAVRVAPCNMRGAVTGPRIDARAAIVDAAEFQRAMRLIDRKYRPLKQILDLFARFRRGDTRVVIAIRA